MIDILREVSMAEGLPNGWSRARYDATIQSLATRLATSHYDDPEEDVAWFTSRFGLSAILFAEVPLLIATSPIASALRINNDVHEVLVDDIEAPRIFVTDAVVERFPLLASDFNAAGQGPLILSVQDFATGLV